MNFANKLLQWCLVIHLKLVSLVNPSVADRAKRMLFLTSTMYKLERIQLINDRNQKYKTILNLPVTPVTEALAEKLSTCIYDDECLACAVNEYGKSKKDALNSNDFVETIISNTPKWLRYGELRMSDDLIYAFEERKAYS